MRVLVTGGTDAVGPAVVDALLQDGKMFDFLCAETWNGLSSKSFVQMSQIGMPLDGQLQEARFRLLEIAARSFIALVEIASKLIRRQPPVTQTMLDSISRTLL